MVLSLKKLAPKVRSVEFIVAPTQCYNCAVEMKCPHHRVRAGALIFTHFVDRMFFYAWDMWGRPAAFEVLRLSTMSLTRRDRFARDVYRLIMEETELEDALVSAYAIGLLRVDVVEAWVTRKTKK
ncbi:hypothetical protein LCGC14_0672870 [marine sediment metagenome]|uniref:Uncharacterized protein n=1 Tax=marine sediment metagenome TaxID=412755 RepID=A0A0F9RAR6_9ZZZZ